MPSPSEVQIISVGSLKCARSQYGTKGKVMKNNYYLRHIITKLCCIFVLFLSFQFVLSLKCLWRYCSIRGFDWHCWPCSLVLSILPKTVRDPNGDLRPPTHPVCLWYQSTEKETTLVLGSSWSMTCRRLSDSQIVGVFWGHMEDHLVKSAMEMSLGNSDSFVLIEIQSSVYRQCP